MKKRLPALAMMALTATFSIAAKPLLDPATQDDMARHRTMAMAHENAAKCLEAGKPDDVCEKQLQIDCTGLAIGRFCGMKHVHY